MKKFLIFYLLILQNLLYGCATCELMVPQTNVNIEIDVEKNRLTHIQMQWDFSSIYSAEMLNQYDKNKNKILDESELKIILNAMLDYLIKKDMLTQIKYAKKDEEATLIKLNYKNFDIKMVEENLIFKYDSYLNLELSDESMLSIVFSDDEGYFTFTTSQLNINSSQFHYTQNLYLFTASVFFTKMPLQKNPQNTTQEKQKESKESIVVEEESSIQSNILQQSIIKIKSLFESIKDEKNPLSYMLLLFFAYIYGLVHALGPGHGKTLVASYFLSNERSYSKALFISIAIGFVHTFSAFLLTLVIYFLVNTFLAQFLDDTVFYTTKIAAVIIISIAIYLIYKKYKRYTEIEKQSKIANYNFTQTPHISTCGCNSCKVDNNSTDIALIISAGIIPCPGTTTLFIFAISLGLYYAGFVSALVMSMGMSTIIFFSALLSVMVRKKTAQNDSSIKKYLEYASLAIILILGLILLLVS